MSRYFIDLHCHTNASFDSLSDPRSVVKAAATRGLGRRLDESKAFELFEPL